MRIIIPIRVSVTKSNKEVIKCERVTVTHPLKKIRKKNKEERRKRKEEQIRGQTQEKCVRKGG